MSKTSDGRKTGRSSPNTRSPRRTSRAPQNVSLASDQLFDLPSLQLVEPSNHQLLLALGIAGPLTGRGADIIITDDIH